MNHRPFALSPSQEAVWRNHEDGELLPATIRVDIEETIEPASLEETLDRVVARHDILRARLCHVAELDLPLQQVEAATPVPIDVHDLRNEPVAARDSRAAALTHAFETEPIPPDSVASLRALLIQTGPGSSALRLAASPLVIDGPGLTLLVTELVDTYQDVRAQRPGRPPHQSYADLVAWYREIANDDTEAAAGHAFWAERKTQSLGTPQLALEQTHIHPADLRPAVHCTELNPATLQKLKDRFNGISPHLLFTVWQVLLFRLSSTPHVIVHRFSDGRDAEELAHFIGPIGRWLPFPVKLDGEMAFDTALRRTADEVQEAEEWQDLAPADVASGRSAPSLVGFEWQDRLGQHVVGESSFVTRHLSACAVPFKLRLTCSLQRGMLTLALHYDPLRYAGDLIARVSDQLLELLDVVGDCRDVAIGRLNMLSAPERSLLTCMNQTEVTWPGLTMVHEVVEVVASRWPERPAVLFRSHALTYEELDTQATILAGRLRSSGVGPAIPVGLLLERDPGFVVALMAVLKAGGAFVSLDPLNPSERLRRQTEKAAVTVLITQASLLDHATFFQGVMICLDRPADDVPTSDMAVRPRVTVDHPAYYIFTSGSTGEPRGVTITHRSLANYARFVGDHLAPSEGSDGASAHFATTAGFGADLGHTALFGALVTGGCFHLLSLEETLDAAQFCHHNKFTPFDVLKTVPCHLDALLAAAQHGKDILPRQLLVLGGEPLSTDLLGRIAGCNSNVQVVNHYGPTETTVGSVFYPVDLAADCEPPNASVPIGQPLPNTDVYVLDEHGARVPIGVPGELYIGGAGLMLGYVGEPKGTSSSLVPDPFSGSPGARLFRTGDIVRVLPTGDIVFCGRRDDQVKLRGFRIELGEVGSSLERHPSIRKAVAMIHGQSEFDQSLIAYVVADNAEPWSDLQTELRTFGQEVLPPQMIPSRLIRLDELPRNRAGKVDRGALPDPTEVLRDPTPLKLTPRSETEHLVADIWHQVLRRADFGIRDRFLEAGGNSLLLVQVFIRLRERSATKITIPDLFEHNTIEKLSHFLDSSDSEAPSATIEGFEL